MRGIKIIKGFYQPDASYLKQIVHIFTSAAKTLQNTENKPQVTIYKFLTGVFITRLYFFKKCLLLLFIKMRQLCCIYTAYFNLVNKNFNQPPL